MEWMALLGPLLGLGSNLVGTAIGNQDNENKKVNTSVRAKIGETAQTSVDGTSKTDSTSSLSNIAKVFNEAISSQTQNQTQSQTSSDTTNQSSTGSGSTSRLDATTLGMLTSSVQDLLATGGSNQAALSSALSSAGQPFDSDAFVSGIVDQASSVMLSDQESELNKIASAAGANSGSNSAAALLANKVRSATGANLAGVRADATARAAEIQGQKAQQVAGLTAASNSNLNTVLAPLLQAQEQTLTAEQIAANTIGNTTGTSTGTTTGKTTTNETTNQTQTGKSTQNQVTSQDSMTAQQQQQQINTKENTNSKKAENDWADFFKDLSGVFNASFFK